MKKIIYMIGFMLILFAGFSQNITYKKDIWGNTIAVDSKENTLATKKLISGGMKFG